MTTDRAQRIQHTLNTPGWVDICDLIDNGILEAQNQIFDLMLRTPDKLTGKAAIKIAAKARALKDLREDIEDSIKILAHPQPNRAGE